ncbi:collagenase [Kitasatospora sp. NPDC001175]|uniref:collagenase n=1 Tax=Kitasatospora sp. NPDC001175 TaxID=3157103 RepID=UPI003D0772DF
MKAAHARKKLPKLLIAAALALTAGIGIAANGPGRAHAGLTSPSPAVKTATPRPGLAPQSATDAVQDDDSKQVRPKDRRPLPSNTEALHQDYSKPARSAAALSKAATAKAGGPKASAAECSTSAFTANTGSALLQAIQSAGPDCINGLFSLTGSDAHLAFQESQMTTVADALATASRDYPGDNSTHVLELVLYLRAGYYVQWNHPSDVGTYGSALQTAIQSALDSFYANPHSLDATDANGAVLSEAVTLIDSASQNARYLPVLKKLLTGYNSSYNNSYNMLTAVNNVYTVLFRGHQNPDFVTATDADPSVLTTLETFANNNLGLLGGPQSYLASNAGTELARFLQDRTLAPTVRPMIKSLLAKSSMTGPTAPLWVGIAAQANDNDQNNCSDYGTCDLANRLKAAVLTIDYQCGTVHIVTQALTKDQLLSTCDSLTGENAYFHNLVKDPGPLPDDHNSAMEVDVFHSTSDYQTYANVIFGVDTNNGGIYEEGDPSKPDNQARFVAYEADWLRPSFQIWNLNHEYTHYLDGRFDTAGDFAAATSTPDTIWWIEGFAEYESYGYRGVTDAEAVADAAKGTYPLSTVFANTYSSGTDRIYPWGYLAVRYMMENHRSDIDTLLGHYRSGDYKAALGLINSIGTSYDADWAKWLKECAASACNAAGKPLTATFTAKANGLNVTLTDTTEGSASITAHKWEFGDGTTSTDANPTKTYTKPGSYHVRLTVTDKAGATATADQTVAVGASAAECTADDTRRLDRNCSRSNLTAAAGDNSYLYIDIPAGTKTLTITTTPGTGTTDLYYSPTTWADSTANTASATGDGPHTLTITSPPTGWNYITLHATTAFTGATVTTEF